MTTTDELATFVSSVDYHDLPAEVVDAVKKRVLDTLGIAIGAVGEEPVERVHDAVTRVSREGPCTLWAYGEPASAPGAAMMNTTLSRYLDFMDSFLAPGETPHPSDNVGAVVACGEREGASGEELIAAIAAAYQVQGELAWNAPVRDRGFDHVTHTVISAACGVASILDLGHEETRSAIGIAGTAHNALRVTRTEGITEWKGNASATAARNATYSALLAESGIVGPLNLFEGQKGWNQVIAGGDVELELDAGCPRVLDTMTKRYVAETYAQSAVEGIVELAEREDLDATEVEAIHLDTFAGAKLIIGGGEGSRYEVETKAQADHSLPYMLAAALADRQMGNAQYEPARIHGDDVQRLLPAVSVEEDSELTERFAADEMPAVLDVRMADGTVHHVEKDAFAGHPSRPMDWAQLETKFESMTTDRYGEARRNEIVRTVRNLEGLDVADLVALLD